MQCIDTISLNGIDRERNYAAWQELIRGCSKSAKTFVIRCWTEERQWIELALKYGSFEASDWSQGKVITGAVTEEFIQMLLSQLLSSDTRVCQKLTPFFSIFFDSGISSEHYGTEVNIWE